MKFQRSWIIIGILSIIAVLIHLFSANSFRVEHYYSTGLYPYISFSLRFLLGWLPFSFGDVMYGLLVLWLLVRLVQFIRLLITRQPLPDKVVPFLKRTLVSFLSIYIIFNVFWGINYNRKGIASQLGLTVEKYTPADLKLLNSLLLQKANAAKAMLLRQAITPANSIRLFAQSGEAYQQLSQQFTFIDYHPASVKISLWGWLGNYVGFLGYYNPFTGEGQVNTTIPKFLHPYTSCHEIAHQLGYAKENEANFVGYLAAAASRDPRFHYSVYLDLFLYANRNLYETDSTIANSFITQLLPEVKDDLVEWRKFNARHKNPVEPMVRWIYGKYLESNQQPSGVMSYDEVTGLLVAYHKKFGRI